MINRFVIGVIPLFSFVGVGAQTDWPMANHDVSGTRFSPLKQINTGNVNFVAGSSFNVEIGGNEVIFMSGPCSGESRDQIVSIAKDIKKAGAKVLRGGAFKPRTSPYTFQGLGVEGLKLLAEARELAANGS